MEKLIDNVKGQIIEALNLDEITPDDIDENAPLFGPDGLGLDSIDALELIVMLEKDYGIKLSDPKQAKSIFTNVKTIAEFISQNGKA
ncbi:MAG: phosphopantetheine-binding protein [Candidatus Egerieousia sp.]